MRRGAAPGDGAFLDPRPRRGVARRTPMRLPYARGSDYVADPARSACRLPARMNVAEVRGRAGLSRQVGAAIIVHLQGQKCLIPVLGPWAAWLSPDQAPVDVGLNHGCRLMSSAPRSWPSRSVGRFFSSCRSRSLQSSEVSAAGVQLWELQRLLDHVLERHIPPRPHGTARESVGQLVDEDAERPPVDHEVVAGAGDDLRGEVLLRPDERVGAPLSARSSPCSRPARPPAGCSSARGTSPSSAWLTLPVCVLGELALDHPGPLLDVRHRLPLAPRQVEVGQLDVARAVYQYVLGLEVPVHEPVEVQVLQRQEHLGGVKLDPGLREALLAASGSSAHTARRRCSTRARNASGCPS